jgi:hypothetical protein
MKRVTSSSGNDGKSKRRRTRIHAVPSQRPSGPGSRHVRLAETGSRLSQRRKDQPPKCAIDDNVDPDDAINEWVDEPQDISSEEPIISTAKPKKRPRKTMDVR